MNKRLSRKIGSIVFSFSNFDSMYQPYSKNQQLKAISKYPCPNITKDLFIKYSIAPKIERSIAKHCKHNHLILL